LSAWRAFVQPHRRTWTQPATCPNTEDPTQTPAAQL
jgi:hypothetical protein